MTGDGQVACWGYYEIDFYTQPVLIDTPLRFTALAVGVYSVCGLAEDGIVYCWSLIEKDQTPTPVDTNRYSTLVAAYTPFSGGYCGVTVQGAGYCWAEGATETVLQPLAVPVQQIGTTGKHTCAILSDGAMSCWGDNSNGELGDSSTTSRSSPKPIDSELRFTALAVMSSRTCGVSTNGGGYCWGNVFAPANRDTSVMKPTLALPDLLVERITTGADHTCFVTPGGAAYCMGQSGAGQLGNGEAGTSPTAPVRVLDPR